MISADKKVKLKEKAREIIEEFESHGEGKREIAFLGACLQSYAVYGDLAFITEDQ